MGGRGGGKLGGIGRKGRGRGGDCERRSVCDVGKGRGIGEEKE